MRNGDSVRPGHIIWHKRPEDGNDTISQAHALLVHAGQLFFLASFIYWDEYQPDRPHRLFLRDTVSETIPSDALHLVPWTEVDSILRNVRGLPYGDYVECPRGNGSANTFTWNSRRLEGEEIVSAGKNTRSVRTAMRNERHSKRNPLLGRFGEQGHARKLKPVEQCRQSTPWHLRPYPLSALHPDRGLTAYGIKLRSELPTPRNPAVRHDCARTQDERGYPAWYPPTPSVSTLPSTPPNTPNATGTLADKDKLLSTASSMRLGSANHVAWPRLKQHPMAPSAMFSSVQPLSANHGRVPLQSPPIGRVCSANDGEGLLSPVPRLGLHTDQVQQDSIWEESHRDSADGVEPSIVGTVYPVESHQDEQPFAVGQQNRVPWHKPAMSRRCVGVHWDHRSMRRPCQIVADCHFANTCEKKRWQHDSTGQTEESLPNDQHWGTLETTSIPPANGRKLRGYHQPTRHTARLCQI